LRAGHAVHNDPVSVPVLGLNAAVPVQPAITPAVGIVVYPNPGLVIVTDPVGVPSIDMAMVPAAPVPPPLPGLKATFSGPVPHPLAPDVYCGPEETPEPVTSCEAATMPF